MIAIRDPDAATITDTEVLIRGAARPARIVERRLDGRLLVAEPGKNNRWLILDAANVPAPLARRLPKHTKVVLERIVVPTEHLDAVVALVEDWAAGGGAEKDAAKAAAAKKAAATRKAKADAAALAVAQAEVDARLAAALAAWPTLLAACEETAALSSRIAFRDSRSFPAPSGDFTIRTPYDERIVMALRSLPGSRWDANWRYWTVPSSANAELRAVLGDLDAWSTEADARLAAEQQRKDAHRAAEQQRKDAAYRARQAELDKRRFLIRHDRAPTPGTVVRDGGSPVYVEDLGRPFRAPDDGLWDPWDEGELFVYAYFRPATPEETAALEASEAKARADREVRKAAEAVLALPGEVVQVGHVPAGEVILEDDRTELVVRGTRDWCVLSEDGRWIWRCEYRGADGDGWGEFSLGYNTRGNRIEATPERVAALRAENGRRARAGRG